MTLRSDIQRLAYKNPPFRRHLVPLLRQATTICDIASGADRNKYVDSVWDLYVRTYRPIGLIVSRSSDLLSVFPLWELCLDANGATRSFGLIKPTPFGLKAGLMGSDGSPEGKALTLAYLRTKFKRPGFTARFRTKSKTSS